MAVAEALPPVYSQLDAIIKEIAQDFTKENLKEVIGFTKRTLGGNYLKLPDDDIGPCLEELRKQGRITPQKTGLLKYYAKDNKSIVEKIKSLKEQSMKEREKESEVIGREDDVRDIVDLLVRDETVIMTLYGDPGVGKTVLANEVVELLKSRDQVAIKKQVDLRNMKDQKEFCLAILEALESKKVLQPCMEFVFEEIENLKKRSVLILDNAEEALSQLSLQESRASLSQMLKGMAEHNKSRNLTILLTSRIPLREKISCVNYQVMPLQESKSATVLEKSNLSLSPDEKNEIIKLCANKPLLLKLVAGLREENLLNSGNIEHLKKVLSKLEKPAFASEKEQAMYANAYDGNIFSEAFEKIFMPELKKATIKLSLFQGAFTLQDAKMMIKQPEEETLFYLNTLKERKFLTGKADERYYEMHPSINEYVTSQFQKDDYKDIVADAKETFFELYQKKSKEIGQLLEKDYVKAYSAIEKQRLNLKLAIEISFERGFLYFSSDYSESVILADLFLILIPGLEREKLFREWSRIAEEKGEWICYSILVCMHITVLLEKTAGKAEARKLLGKVKEALGKLSNKASDTYRLAESSYFYAEGEMFYSDCESKGRADCRRAEWEEVLDFYQKSLKIREELLKDHTDTARTLNAIGNCYMYLEELENAREHYTRALEMRRRLSGSQQHVDMPVYINQIGATHEQMGKRYQQQAFDANLYYRKGLTEKYLKEFNEALKKYQEALDLEKKLHISGYINTATFYRNMSNTYSFLEDYESSLKTAKKALFVRKKLLGIDSDTIRSYYQVGLAYEKLEDIDRALKYFYKAYMMEQALPEGETSPVRDRVIRKIENNGGSIEEAKSDDEQHKEALKKGSLDDDILTSGDEKEDEEEKSSKEEWPEKEKTPSKDSTLDIIKGTTVQKTDQGPPGPTIQKPEQGPPGPTVQKTDKGPPGPTIQKTDQGPPEPTIRKTNQGPSGTTQKEREMSEEVLDIEIEESVLFERQVIGTKGFQWNIKDTGVRILFQPGTVQSDTSISCHVHKQLDKQHPSLEPTESLVSMVVRLDADNPVFEEEIGLLIPHCGAMKTKGYEVTVKEYAENSGSWEEVDGFINIQSQSDLQNIEKEFTKNLEDIKLPAVFLSTRNSSTVCVTCRLVKDVFIARPAGSTLVSSVFPEVQLVMEKNTVKKNTPINMRVHPLPDFTVFNSPDLSCGPVLYLETGQSKSDLHKSAKIHLPHPRSWYGNRTEGDTVRGQVHILYNEHSDNSSTEWKDITDDPGTNISVNEQKISFQVRHFSMFWPIWISDVKQDIQKLLNRAKELFSIIGGSPPFSALFCVRCLPRIHKGQAVLQYIALPSHLVKSSKRISKYFYNSEEELYDQEQIQVDLDGKIGILDSDDATFYIKFSSKEKRQKAMSVKVEDEDAMFNCRFLRVLANNQRICKIPFELLPVPQAIGELKPLEFYGIPLEDPDNKWMLLEAPKDVLKNIQSIKRSSEPYSSWPADVIESLRKVANKAYDIRSSDEDSWRFFFESVSHTSLQQFAFDAVIATDESDCLDHIKQVLLTGRKIVETPLDQKIAKRMSQIIEEDYIKLAQAADLSDKCAFVKKMKGTSSDRCFIFLKTWISNKKPTLHSLMQKLKEAGCKKGMDALLKHFEELLETERMKLEASATNSESTMVTVEGHYQETATVEPLLAAEHTDTGQTFSSPATQSSGYVVQDSHGSHVGSDNDSPAEHILDGSTVNVSSASDTSLDNGSSHSGSTTSDPDKTLSGEDRASYGDSPDSASDIMEQPDRSTSLFYTGLCLVALTLGFVYFRYIRR